MNDTTAVVTTDLTKAELQLALSKEGLVYQQLLQDAENVVFTKDNLNDERTALVSLRKVKSKLDAMQNPWTEKWKSWNESRKSLVDPVAAVLQKKEGEFRKLANEIATENQHKQAEEYRKKTILYNIDLFFLDQSQAISGAKTAEELIRIEKLIGSHKANSSRYQEFLPLLNAKAANLTELIKVQKEAIKVLTALKGKEMAAESKGDDEEVLKLREMQEEMTSKLEETKIKVQESAINMASEADVIEPEVIVAIAPKPRRQSWKWEVVDIKSAFKAGLTEIVPCETKINEILKEKKEAETECTENGIRYFIEKRW